MCAFVSAQLPSVSAHACTWSTFKSLYLQPLDCVSLHMSARKHLSRSAYTHIHQSVYLCSTVCVCVCVCMCVCVRACVCVHACKCLTIFVSIFSTGTDFAPQDLDVFATGTAVELVDPVVSPAHGVSHLRLVLHMHTEVDSIHTKYLLGTHAQTHRGRQTSRSWHTQRDTESHEQA